ncbi:MAG: membrane bound O-acyl transferase family-domain-containing protein [Phycisphaerae bacterium]|jgi:alginate O-acetyltransferase complex protein AlgI
MAGLFVLLGFGVPHLASMFWCRLGLNVEPIMHNPLLARSLADFWGRRWNRAFRDVVCPLFCHPLMPRFGRGGALIIGFLVSGLVHELVISFPSRSGFGGPTAYFLMQAFGVLIQRRLNTPHFVRHRVILSRISTFAFLTAPLPLLYPALFIDRIVLPFLRVIGAT